MAEGQSQGGEQTSSALGLAAQPQALRFEQIDQSGQLRKGTLADGQDRRAPDGRDEAADVAHPSSDDLDSQSQLLFEGQRPSDLGERPLGWRGVERQIDRCPNDGVLVSKNPEDRPFCDVGGFRDLAGGHGGAVLEEEFERRYGDGRSPLFWRNG